MASTTMEVRLEQKASREKEVGDRIALLKKRGFDENGIAKDPVLKNLKAKLKQASERIKAIEKKNRRTEELMRIKAEKSAQPKEEPKEEPKAKAKEKGKGKEKAEKTASKEKAPKKKKEEAPKAEA